jgi:hypothetical protein
MAAPKGNTNAEKVSLEDAIALAELAYSKISDDCYFLSQLADECDTYRQKFEYVLEKYNDNEIVFDTIKKIYNKCESIVMKKTASGDIVPSLGIFVLKAYHGLMETSKQQTDITTNGQSIADPPKWVIADNSTKDVNE